MLVTVLMSFRYDGDDVKEGGDERRNVTAYPDPNLVLRLRGGSDDKPGGKKVGRPKKKITAADQPKTHAVPRSRTREKSTSERGAESEAIVTDHEASGDEVEVEKQEEVDVVNEEELDKQIASTVACCPCGNTNPLTTSKVDCIRCKQVWHAECLGIGGVSEDLVGTWINYLCPFCFVEQWGSRPGGNKAVAVENDADECKVVTLKEVREELTMLHGKIRADLFALPKSVGKGGIDARSCDTIKVMLKDELHQTSGMMAAQIEEKVTKSITEKTKLWSSLLKAKTTVTVDDDMLNHIVNKTADHQVEVTEIKNCDTDLQRKRRVRNVVIKKVMECSAKDAKKRMEYDMKILTDVIGIGKDEIVTCFRAGRKTENADPATPRPLVCTLTSEKLVAYHTHNGEGFRVENPHNGAEPYWINRDLCKADADAAFRARKAAAVKRKLQREAMVQLQQK